MKRNQHWRRRGRAHNRPASFAHENDLFLESLGGRAGEGRGGEHRHSRNARANQKALQLCRTAQRAVALALAGECNDDRLRELTVESVIPAPDATHLLVRVVLPGAWDAKIAAEVLERLHRVRGLLRASVAGAVTRKRAPELSFITVAPPSEGEGVPS